MYLHAAHVEIIVLGVWDHWKWARRSLKGIEQLHHESGDWPHKNRHGILHPNVLLKGSSAAGLWYMLAVKVKHKTKIIHNNIYILEHTLNHTFFPHIKHHEKPSQWQTIPTNPGSQFASTTKARPSTAISMARAGPFNFNKPSTNSCEKHPRQMRKYQQMAKQPLVTVR